MVSCQTLQPQEVWLLGHRLEADVAEMTAMTLFQVLDLHPLVLVLCLGIFH